MNTATITGALGAAAASASAASRMRISGIALAAYTASPAPRPRPITWRRDSGVSRNERRRVSLVEWKSSQAR